MAKASNAETVIPSLLTNPLDNMLGYQLRRASQAMLDDLVSALAEYSLRPSNASILFLIASNPGLTQSHIGQLLAIERANMAPITAKLVNQGLLIRSPANGRKQGLHLSAEGKVVVKKIRIRIAKHEEKFWQKARISDRGYMLETLSCLWKETD